MKMYCIVARTSLDAMGGNRGKLAAQAGHAYLHAWWDSIRPRFPYSEKKHIIETAIDYGNSMRATKICLVVDTVEELETLRDAYKDITGVSLVNDAGLTCFDGPTVTCLGIGPIRHEDIGDDIKTLKVLI